MRTFARILALSIWTAALPTTPFAAAADDPVILKATDLTIWGGRDSPYAAFQTQLQAFLDTCGKSQPYVVTPNKAADGKIGKGTRAGIKRATTCTPLAHTLPTNSAARSGAITSALWLAVMKGAAEPTLQDKADAIVLTFEQTELGGPPEWNFCQNGPHDNPTAPGFVCTNTSDPKSFLTWGPRGATVGGGREVQWVLWLARSKNQALVDDAFGDEAAAMQRFLTLCQRDQKGCGTSRSAEKFMCLAWITPSRKQAWDQALIALGNEPVVRRVYKQLYDSAGSDGGKIARFFSFWSSLGVTPSQVDFAFFSDRAAQTGGPEVKEDRLQTQLSAVQDCIKKEPSGISANARARRCYAINNRTKRQSDDRLGRDVTFYLEAYQPSGLTKEETKVWGDFHPFKVGDFGLSDATAYGSFSAPELNEVGPKPTSDDLTSAEETGCPAPVLDSVPD